MLNEIDLLKKEQRIKLSKKRINLKETISVDKDFFKESIITYKWFQESKIIASFFSIKSEISTDILNEFIQKQGKILCLPIIDQNDKSRLFFKSYRQGDDTIIGEHNIKEPNSTNIYIPDLIFTPCLAFDLNGFRLGYGGGYYDKTISFLKSIGHKFLTVGLAFDDQKVDKVFHNHLDQKLNYILTEKRIYKIL